MEWASQGAGLSVTTHTDDILQSWSEETRLDPK